MCATRTVFNDYKFYSLCVIRNPHAILVCCSCGSYIYTNVEWVRNSLFLLFFSFFFFFFFITTYRKQARNRHSMRLRSQRTYIRMRDLFTNLFFFHVLITIQTIRRCFSVHVLPNEAYSNAGSNSSKFVWISSFRWTIKLKRYKDCSIRYVLIDFYF